MADLRGRGGAPGGPGTGPEALVIHVEAKGVAVIIRPSGDVDLAGSPLLRQELRKAQATQPGRLVIDLSLVPYMDSSGVATLVEAMQAARRGNTKLLLSGLQDKVRSIFEIARLDTVFTIVTDVDAAIASQ